MTASSEGRRVTAHLFHSLNGVVEDPHLWQFDAFGEEEGALMEQSLAGVTDVIIGRKLWLEWSKYWPDANDPFAQFINPIRKHVISSKLSGELPWNSALVDGDPLEYIQDLRHMTGGGIAVVGGIETIRSLFLAGAIDALTLTSHPVIAEEGRRLFDDSVSTSRLQLLEAKFTSRGNAVLTYSLRCDEA